MHLIGSILDPPTAPQVPKALWLKLNEPETFDRATFICEYQDFLNHRLTGRMVASTNNAAIRWHWHAGTVPPASLLQKVGLEVRRASSGVHRGRCMLLPRSLASI